MRFCFSQTADLHVISVMETLSELFSVYHDEIYRYLWRGCYDDALAQDLTQETFFKAWRAFHRLPADANHRAWLYRIATNVQRDDWRKHRRIVDADLDQMADATNIEAGYIEQELLEQVAQRVAALPEKQRQAFILARYQLLDYHEIAAVLDCSEATARANVYQALKKLREWFGNDEA